MNEISRLAIVVDTANAEAKLKAFTAQLKAAEDAGRKLGSSSGQASAGLNSQAQSANKAAIEQNKLATSISNATAAATRARTALAGEESALNRAAASALNLVTAQNKVTTSATQAATAQNRLATSATQVQVGNNRVLVSAEQVATAQYKTASAATKLAADNNRLSVSAVQVATAEQRLATATAQTAAANTRASIATVNHANAQQRLVSAALATATAEQRLAAQTTRAAAEADRAALATLRLAQAQARAAAAANGHAGAMGRASGASRTLFQDMNKLYTLMNSGLVIYGGLGFVKVAADMQNLNNQIRLVTESEYEYLGMKKEVMKIANENYNDVASTISLYQKSVRALTNLGKSQADSLKFTEAVSLAMRTGGRSAGEQAAAILQLGQAMGAGVIMGDEFRSISENAPVLLDLVAKKMGVLQGDLKKLSADGKIPAEIMYEALTENMGALEELANKMPLTMGQAFIVAKNKFKAYTDEMMNSTGGVSDKITGMLVGISDNFDTIAKVGIAGVVLGLTGMIASLATATKAMQLFNFVTSSNPLMLLVSGFLLVNSAIFGTNDVLTISGIMLSDFFDGMGTMLKDGEAWWMDFSATVATAMGITVKEVAEANDKNSKNFLGFYEQTEKGFAGVVQGLGTAIGSVTAIFGTFFEILGRWTDNMFTTFENMGKAAYNAGNRVRMWFGGEDQQQEYGSFKSLDGWSVYKDTFNSNQDAVRGYAQGLNTRSGVVAPKAPNTFLQNRTRFGKVGFNSIVNPQAGSGVYAKAYLPSAQGGSVIGNRGAFNANTDPRDMDAKVAYENRKLQDAADAQEKALKKATAAQEKLTKEQNKGLTNRLVGISGDTGVGNAHLHIQYRDKSRPVSPADLARFQAGGKAITDYPMTSGYGKRNTDIKGASTNHKGTDFGIPKNTPITTSVAVKNVKTWKDGKGGGYVSTITFEDGVVIDLLHQMPSVMGVEKGASTGNKQIDSMVAKAESNIAREAAKAEKERIRAAEEAQRERERIAALNLKLMKEYGDKEAQLAIENDARVAEINESSFNGTKKAELIKESERRMNQELAVYKKGLDDRVNELVKFQKTGRDLLKKQYDDEVFEIVSHPELSRPENSDMLKQALENAKLANEYRVSLYEESLEQQKSAMYAFQKTERDILIDGWENKLADAMLMYDELRDYRIEAIKAEGRLDVDIFDTNQELKLLEPKKGHMTEMAYIKARHELERQLINLSNEPQEVKDLQINALKQPSVDALMGVMSGIQQETPLGKIQADYESRLAKVEEYERLHTDMLENAKIARLAIEQSYMDAKRDLMLTQGEALFGNLAGLSKAFLGEQSGLYKSLFAIEKAYTLASVLLKNEEAISKAWASAAFPYNLPAVASAVAGTAGIASAVQGIMPKGFKQGGYTGNMGASQVAGVVHGQEYVFDAQSTKRIGVDNLNAMRSGKAVGGGGDVNINVNVDAKGNAQVSGDNERMGRDMANGIKAVVMDTLRKEKRQGGMLYG